MFAIYIEAQVAVLLLTAGNANRPALFVTSRVDLGIPVILQLSGAIQHRRVNGRIPGQNAPAVPVCRQSRPKDSDPLLCPVASYQHHIGNVISGYQFTGAPAVKGAAVLRHRHNGRRVVVIDAPVIADPQQSLRGKAQPHIGKSIPIGIVFVIKHLRHHPHTAAAVQQHHHRLIMLFVDLTAVCPVFGARGIEVLAAASGSCSA